MPLYKEFGVIASGLSLADLGKPGRYVPFASVFAWSNGCFRLARQFVWREHEHASADAATVAARRLAEAAIDRDFSDTPVERERTGMAFDRDLAA